MFKSVFSAKIHKHKHVAPDEKNDLVTPHKNCVVCEHDLLVSLKNVCPECKTIVCQEHRVVNPVGKLVCPGCFEQYKKDEAEIMETAKFIGD